METDLWQTDTQGRLVCEHREHLLVAIKDQYQYHYLVFRRRSSEVAGEILLASGTTDGLRPAMDAAQRIAERSTGTAHSHYPQAPNRFPCGSAGGSVDNTRLGSITHSPVEMPTMRAR
jgi:hypothetical protein